MHPKPRMRISFSLVSSLHTGETRNLRIKLVKREEPSAYGGSEVGVGEFLKSLLK